LRMQEIESALARSAKRNAVLFTSSPVAIRAIS
jgi:hypothetical protein